VDMWSIKVPGRLKKNFDRSNTPSVVRSLWAFDAFSTTGRNTWSALLAATSKSEFAIRKDVEETYASACRGEDVRHSRQYLRVGRLSSPHINLEGSGFMSI
jgi:hypothetical protein